MGHPFLLTSVCFAGVDSLEVFIFLWGREVFNGMKGVFGFKVICEEMGKEAGEGGGLWGSLAKATGLSSEGDPCGVPTHPGML